MKLAQRRIPLAHVLAWLFWRRAHRATARKPRSQEKIITIMLESLSCQLSDLRHAVGPTTRQLSKCLYNQAFAVGTHLEDEMLRGSHAQEVAAMGYKTICLQFPHVARLNSQARARFYFSARPYQNGSGRCPLRDAGDRPFRHVASCRCLALNTREPNAGRRRSCSHQWRDRPAGSTTALSR